ncbi:helix-hairpin-helix domain-containing protein [Paraburkholderia terrae]|uniref:Crossover junction endonuclease MUS81-like HHH domain-containing protein n=1 Tax=Paraburkholderia terrae TaxID=311230 RepID=A0ABM7U065_9BURK|nr:helix-hairpin-helix domain-containing protein [Paraburkholderia terrae]BCZ84420.1 hypothetical protein PTKU64_80950 [Paraburkholderia terrae]BDC45672.1 hypothetical protein PTKU15_89690 [Paraburkholderia terrae]
MPIHNADIAEVFNGIADLLEIQGGNPFRVRAYRNAARSVAEYGQNVRTMMAQSADLKVIPAIDDDLSLKIREIVTTGSCSLLASLRAQVPSAVLALLRVPGLGPKRVRRLYEQLHVQSLEQLKQAATEGRIHALRGFGALTEAHILANLQTRDPVTTRYVAQLFEAVGASRFTALDVHNLVAYQNAFRVPTEHLEANEVLAQWLASHLRDTALIVVSPDARGVRRAEDFRARLSKLLDRPVEATFAGK